MPQNCIAPRPEEDGGVMVQGLPDMSETQSKSVQPGLQMSMYPITLKVCVSFSLSLEQKKSNLVHFLSELLSFTCNKSHQKYFFLYFL